jgi:membrane protease YdiL (CAAX protease family)
MARLRAFAENHPFWFVVALSIFQPALAIPVVAVGKALGTSLEPVRLAVPIVQSVFIMWFIWTMGWSRACGLTGTVRNAHLLIFPAIVHFAPAVFYGTASIPAAGVSLFFFAVLATGISEEGLTRGVAIPLLLRYGKWAAVLLAAVMFSMGHLTNAFFNDFSIFDWIEVFAATFGMGVLYGALFLRTGSLLPLIYLHTIEDYIYVTSGTAGPYAADPIGFGPHLLLSGTYILAGLLLMFTVTKEDIVERRLGGAGEWAGAV